MTLFENKPKRIREKLREGMQLMHVNDLDRIILTIYPEEAKIDPRDKELYSIDFLYYPFENLFQEERDLIIKGVDYNLIALICKESGPIKYPLDCIELIGRTKLNPPHDSQHPECQENYYSDKRFIPLENEEKMKIFSGNSINWGWTPEILERIFQKEIKRKQGIEPEYVPLE